MQQNIGNQATKREPFHRRSEPELNNQPKKRQKKLKQNPFQDLLIDDQPNQKEKNEKSSKMAQQQWIKPKVTPLTVSVCDHSKINKYYSHKSLQKYIQYLCVKNCPNPLWLSIKRQSQIQMIVLIDIQIENNLFYNSFNNVQSASQEGEKGQMLKFIQKFNKPSLKAVYKQSPFLKDPSQLWDAVFVYDHEAVKQQSKSTSKISDLPPKLTEQILKYYQTYTLTQAQRKYNLYPMPGLPAFKQYYCFESEGSSIEVPLKDRILVIDCEMVMCGVNFELARASIMNFEAELIYDQFFKPEKKVTNYLTQFSGITEDTLKDVTKTIADLHKDLQKIMTKDTILVGHSLENDLHAMKLLHEKVVDTSVLYARRNGSKMKLKTLTYQILNRTIQVGSHCSQEDCRATLQLMRLKVEGCEEVPSLQNKTYHLLNELKQADKKIVIIDSDLQFIKHRKEYIGIQYQEVENCKQNKGTYISKFTKYFDKHIKNPDVIFSRIRKTNQEEWQEYYQRVDETLEQIYGKSIKKTVFFLNFQVNNSCQIHPQDISSLLERKRPFSLFLVQDQ